MAAELAPAQIATGVPIETTLATEEHWVSLHWDRYALAVPQHHISSVELSADVREGLPSEMAAGWYPAHPKPYPVYRFDDRMWPTRGLSKSGFVMLMGGEEPWGIWGESVNVERADSLPRFVEMPAIFKRTVNPAEALAVAEDGKPMLICTQQSLNRWVQALLARRNR